MNNPMHVWRLLCKESQEGTPHYWIRVLDHTGTTVLSATRTRNPHGPVSIWRTGTACYWELWTGDMSVLITRIILMPEEMTHEDPQPAP